MKTTVYLVRHAEAQGNIERLFQGWTDGLLSEKGHRQAELLGDRLNLEEIDGIYVSALKRTQETASYIAKLKNLNMNIRDDLCEINGGEWENVPFDLLPSKWPKEYEAWNFKPDIHQMPGGESMKDVFDRIRTAILSIIEENKGKSICIVSHGTAIRTFMCYLLGVEFTDLVDIPWFENTAVTKFTFENGEVEVLLEGDISHLTKDMSTLYNQEWFEEYTKYIKEKKINGKK